MSDDNQSERSMQDRINSVLHSGNASKSASRLPTVEAVEELDELEFALARAERDLRVAEERVKELRIALRKKRREGASFV